MLVLNTLICRQHVGLLTRGRRGRHGLHDGLQPGQVGPPHGAVGRRRLPKVQYRRFLVDFLRIVKIPVDTAARHLQRDKKLRKN